MRGVAACLLAGFVATASPLAAPRDDASLEREARAIETMVIAPCCWSQQVSVHQSPAATDMKTRIRQMLDAGLQRQEILDAFQSEFGARILAEPPARGFNLLLYIVPLLTFVLTAAGLWVLVRTMTRHRPATEPDIPADLDARYTDRLRDELDDLD